MAYLHNSIGGYAGKLFFVISLIYVTFEEGVLHSDMPKIKNVYFYFVISLIYVTFAENLFFGMKKIVILVCGALMAIDAVAQMDMDQPLRKLEIAELAIKSLYVDEVDEGKLVEDGIRGMLEKLDPHSSYSTPKEGKTLNEPQSSRIEGIDVKINIIKDK